MPKETKIEVEVLRQFRKQMTIHRLDREKKRTFRKIEARLEEEVHMQALKNQIIGNYESLDVRMYNFTWPQIDQYCQAHPEYQGLVLKPQKGQHLHTLRVMLPEI